MVQVNNTYYNNVAPARQAHSNPRASVYRPGAWQHDPDHRGGLGYRSVDAQQRFGPGNVPPDRGSQVRPADARRSSSSMGARPDTRFEARPVDARSGAETRPHAQPAPAAPIEMRIVDRRADVRPQVQTGALPPRDTALVRPVNTHRLEIRPQLHANPQAARIEPSTRLEASRSPQPRMEIRPAPSTVRQEPAGMAVPRHEPAARREVPHASAPRAEIRPPQAAARQETRANAFARSKTNQ